MEERVFSRDEASAVLEELRPAISEIVSLRADLTEAVGAHEDGDESVPLADLKAMEARLSEILDAFRARGLQVKGWAPILLDFPMEPDGEILLCWLEGEDDIAWYHPAQHGFAGRRPLDDREGRERP